MPDRVLFRVQKVDVSLNADDLPGPTRSKATCALCGQVVRDRREVVIEGVTLCRPCGRGAYFKNAQDVAWSELDWTPDHPSPVSRFDFHSCPKPTLKARPWCERVQGLPRNSRLRPRIGMTFQVRRPLAFSKGKGSIRCLLNQPLWVLAPRARAKTSER